jgi:Tfp pilus assembly pilus retraction ATPase PilT
VSLQFALVDALRGVIVQVLLRKIGGGRLPAREVLLNTPAVSTDRRRQDLAAAAGDRGSDAATA